MKFRIKLLCFISSKGKSKRAGSTIKKLVMISKMTAALVLFATLHVSAGTSAQAVSYQGKNVGLEKVFSSIKQQTGYVFIYSDKVIAMARPVSITVKKLPVESALKEVLKGQPLAFEIQGNTIVISEKQEEKKPGSLILLPLTADAFLPPPSRVHGKISNENGEPLAGINISLKGGKVVGVTGNNGEFTLTNIDDKATLVFSAVSIETLVISLNGRTELNLSAKTKVSVLDDVEMIAYGTTTRRLSTSAVAKVTGEDISKQPVDNPMLALGGRMPGLQIIQTGGSAGAPIAINIRGRSSLGAGSEPLYIIDGVPFAHSLSSVLLANGVSAQTLGGINNSTNGTNPFVNLNASDIESIEVLKDADATAIYGSRGANGVVLITTKKAKSGKTKVDVNFSNGWGHPTRTPKMLNTQQYLAMRREAFRNDGIVPTASNASDLFSWDSTRYINWPELLLGKADNRSDAQVRLSTGSQLTQYSLSAGYYKESPIIVGNMYDERISFRSSLVNHSADNKFHLTVNASYNVDNTNYNTTDMSQFVTTIPNSPYPLDSTGNLVWSDNGVNFSNPLSYLKKTYKGVTENIINNINLGYRLSSHFELKLDGGVNFLRITQRSANPLSSQFPSSSALSSAQFYNQSQSNWILEPQANYSTMLGKGRLMVLVGGSFQQQLVSGTNINASGYISDNLLETPGPASTKTVTSNYAKYRYAAFFGRINYNLYNKYLINISGRRDGSSRFGPGKQFGNFGAIGAGWIFTEEPFMKRLKFLNYGKIRASYGVTGNDRIGNYQYIARWGISSTALPYQGVNGIYPINLDNPDFEWEINRKLEGGIELSFLKDRVIVNADFYRNRTNNQLTGLTLPSQTGFTSLNANRNALVQNNGWEFMINTTNIITKNFTWRNTFNISIPHTKLVAYPDFENSGYSSFLAIGQPITIRKYLQFQGVDSATGVIKLNGTNLTTDRVQVANLAQIMFGGWQNSFTYKRWSLDLFVHFVKQKGLTGINFQAPGARSNQSVQVLGRWQNSGDITNIQKFSTTGAAVTQYSLYANYSDARIADASFIRLKNVSLSYLFSKKLLEKIKISSLRMYLQAQNLLTISPYPIGDPETLSLSNASLRMVSAGVQMVF